MLIVIHWLGWQKQERRCTICPVLLNAIFSYCWTVCTSLLLWQRVEMRKQCHTAVVVTVRRRPGILNYSGRRQWIFYLILMWVFSLDRGIQWDCQVPLQLGTVGLARWETLQDGPMGPERLQVRQPMTQGRGPNRVTIRQGALKGGTAMIKHILKTDGIASDSANCPPVVLPGAFYKHFSRTSWG